MYVATAVTLLFFLVPSPVVDVADAAAAALLGG
jgi:hypothetical protein